MSTSTLQTTSHVAHLLNIPATTLVGLEKRGAVGPWQRDSAGRRLLTDEDVAAVRAYLESRNRLKAA